MKCEDEPFCEHCTPAGYMLHHPKCPYSKESKAACEVVNSTEELIKRGERWA